MGGELSEMVYRLCDMWVTFLGCVLVGVQVALAFYGVENSVTDVYVY